MKIKLLVFITVFVLIISAYPFANTQEIKGSIIAIMPKSVFISTDESLNVDDKIKVSRDNSVIAILKVTKVKGKILETEIVEKYADIQFKDMLAKEIKEESSADNQEQNNNDQNQTENNQTTENTENTTTTTESTTSSETSTSTETQTNNTATQDSKNTATTSNTTDNSATQNTQSTTTTENTTTTNTAEQNTTNQNTATTNTNTSNTNNQQQNTLSKNNSSVFAPQKMFKINLGYSMLNLQGFGSSKSGYLAEFGFKFKLPIDFSLQYTKHNWSNLKLNSFSVNANYPLFSIPTLLTLNTVLGYTKFSGNSGVSTSVNASGLSYGVSLILYKYLKIDYKLHGIKLNLETANYNSAQQISISIVPLYF